MEDNQLTQPILNPISAFDATQQYTFTFVVIGGNQVVANMLTINDNSDGSQVYQATQSTMRLEHVLPANTLENGHYYSVTVQTIDNAEQLSEASVAVPFYCYSTPSLTISNMPSSGTINNNSYTFQGAYSQSEGEALNSYQFTLYNNNREVISQTSLIYYSSDSSLQYTFTGMSSNTSYFIELSGQTVNGTQITSGVLSFNVNYSSSASFAICDLVNDCENGYIQISSNVVAIQGNSNPEPPIYIDDKEVDLREDGSYVNWDSGFNIQNDFTMRVWGRDFNPYEDIINMSNNQDSDEDPNRINMKWMLGNIDKELPEYNSFSNNFVNLTDSIEEDIEDFMICGNSVQESREGNNLYNIADVNNQSSLATVDSNNWVTINKTEPASTVGYSNFFIKSSTEIQTSSTYYLVLEIKELSGNGTLVLSQDLTTSPSQIETNISRSFSDLSVGKRKYTVTTAGSFEDADELIRTFVAYDIGETGKIVFRVSLLEEDPDLDTFVYERYGVSPSTHYPSDIYSLGDIKNLINVENFNITYSQQYSQDTNTQFILKPNYTYTLSFDYLINNATTDLYYSIGYGTTSYTTDIATQIQYNTQIEGRNYYTFTVPANIPENNYLWIKFGQTIILADINVDISNIQLEKGIYNTAYQSPSIYNIYNVIAQKNVFNNNETLYIKDNNTTHTTITNGYNIVPTSTTEETYLAIGYNNVLQEGNTYAISLNSLGQFDSIKLYMTEKGSQEIYSEIELTNNSFIAPSNLYDLQICIYVDNSSLDNYAEIWNIQIEANTTPTTYESYNGIVSTFSLDDTLKSTPYTRDLICLKSPNILNNSGEADVIGNEDYYYSQLGTTSYNISYINEDNNVISSLDITNGVLHTPANCVKIKVNNLNSEDITNNRLQINKGNSAFGYYPYFETPSIIRWVKRIILDGVTQKKMCTGVTTNDNFIQIAIANSDILLKTMAMCNIASSVEPAQFGIVNTITVGNSRTFYIHLEPDTIEGDITVSTINTWLNNLYTQGTPIYIDYITESPEITELTEQQITLLQNAKSNQGITNIYMNNSYPALLTGEYANSYSVQETQNAYVILRCYNNNNLPYIITSNYIDIPSDTDKVFIWVRRVNNIFDLRIENLGDYSEGGGGDDTTDPVVTIEADPIITSNSITITANAIDDTGLRTIRFSKNNGSTWDEERAIDGLSVTEEYTFADLTADTQYAIRVEAIDLSGNIGGISEQLTTAAS